MSPSWSLTFLFKFHIDPLVSFAFIAIFLFCRFAHKIHVQAPVGMRILPLKLKLRHSDPRDLKRVSLRETRAPTE